MKIKLYCSACTSLVRTRLCPENKAIDDYIINGVHDIKGASDCSAACGWRRALFPIGQHDLSERIPALPGGSLSVGHHSHPCYKLYIST